MAAKVLLLILPLSVLCYNLENVENQPYSDLIRVDKIVLNNIEEGKFIGCKYQNLCSNNRVCYNDKLFGTCVRESDETNFIYELAAEFQNILELAMRDLFEQDYKWGDFYTQCFLQSVLISSELQQFLDVQHCKQNTQPSISLDPAKLKLNSEMKDEIIQEFPRIYDRSQNSKDSETFYKNIKSLLQQIQDKKRVDSNYQNKEMINPKSNSEEANSVTKVDYADPKLIRKVLKVAKRRTNDWVWLKFDKKISKNNEAKIMDSIIKSLPNPVKIGKTEWTRDKSIISFKILPNSAIHSENVTDFFNNHKNIIPGFTILETGSGKKIQTSIIAEEISSDQNFIITLIICSVVFLGVILVLIGFCVQKFRYKRDKLGNILKSKFSDNSSTSYKELFRVTTNKDTAVKAKQGVARMNSKQHSGETPAASSPVSTRSSTSSWTDEMQVATNMDIYTGHMILTYMEKHLKNKEIFQSEWNLITSYEAEDAKTEIAIKIENLPKNRFQDKIPYDKSRVVLKNQKNGDYINASLIVDHDPKIPVYIASQAPLEKYVADFWQMVWEQGVVVIVNLTETNEVESSQYWPKEGSQIFNIYEVNLVSEHIWSDEYLVRNFYLKNLDTAETRTVTQFHFVSWPADKLPNSSRSILEFRRKVNKSYRSKSTPIIIHCNDGCGRTGTYILLDLVLNRICKGLKEMDIAATLEHLRDQRMHLVKTEDQFGFVLTTISEEVNNILKILNQ